MRARSISRFGKSQPNLDVGRLGVVVERDVLGERELEHEPAPLAILGNVADSRVEHPPRRSRGGYRCARRPRIDPACDRPQAGDRVDQLGLAVPVDAGDRRRSRPRARSSDTSATFSIPRSSTTLQSVDLERDLTRLATASSRRAAAPRGRPSSARATPRSRPPPERCRSVLPRRSTVIRSAISSTSLSLWVMKMIDFPSAFSRSMIAKSSAASCGVSTAVGSSRIRIVGAAVERLQDLDPLLLADGDLLDEQRPGRRRGRTACESSSHALPRRARLVEQHADRGAARSPRTMFSATVITGISMKCWCTIPIPCLDRVLRRAEGDGLSAHDGSRPSPACVEPVEDVHQRRLARAVLAEQRVDLARPQVEVDVVVRDDARDSLRDAAELEDRRRLRSCERRS